MTTDGEAHLASGSARARRHVEPAWPKAAGPSTLGFHDYTIASPMERFVAVLDSALGAWEDTGLHTIVHKGTSHRQQDPPSLVKVQVALKHRLKWRREPYLLSLHLPAYVILSDQTPLQPQGPATGDVQPLSRLTSAATAAMLASQHSLPAASLEEVKGASSRSLHAHMLQSLDTVDDDELQRGHSGQVGERRLEGEGREGADEGDGWEVGVTLDMQSVINMMRDMDAIMDQPDTQQGGGQLSETNSVVSIQGAGQASEGGSAADLGSQARAQAGAGWLDMDIGAPGGDEGQPRGMPEGQNQGDVQPERQGSEPSDLNDTPFAAGVRMGGDTDSAAVPAGIVPAASTLPAAPTQAGGYQAPVATSGLAQGVDDSGSGRQRGDFAGASRGVLTQAAVPAPLPWWPWRVEYRPWWQHTHQHKLQHWFGLDHFLLMQPQSFSKRFLDEGEALSVISSTACALSGRGLAWPLLAPVHDALRDAYHGMVLLPPTATHPGGATMRLLADCVHISKVADPLLTLRGQVRVFAGQLAAAAPAAAAMCYALLDGNSGHPGRPAAEPSGEPTAHLELTARYTWRLAPPPAAVHTPHRVSFGRNHVVSSGGASSCDSTWDEESAWAPWASHGDPITCIELDIVWQDLEVRPAGGQANALSEAGTATSICLEDPDHPSGSLTPPSPGPASGWPRLEPSSARHWVVHALQRGLSDEMGAVLGLLAPEKQRQHVKLGEGLPQTDSCRSFHAMLAQLALLRQHLGDEDTTMGELAGDSWWWDRPASACPLPHLAPVPSEAALAAILVDVWEGGALAPDSNPPSTSATGGAFEALKQALNPPSRDAGPTEAGSGLGAAGDEAPAGLALGMAQAGEGWEGAETIMPSDADIDAGMQSLPPSRPTTPSQLGHQEDGPGQPEVVDSQAQTAGVKAPQGGHSTSGGTGLSSEVNPGQGPVEAGGVEGRRYGGGAAVGEGGVSGHPYLSASSLDSPLTRLALHCLVCGNLRAIAVLWTRFLRSVRLEWWEACTRLPLGAAPAAPSRPAPASDAYTGHLPDKADVTLDPQACLIHQKLQVLDACIARLQAKDAASGRTQAMGMEMEEPETMDSIDPSEDGGFLSASEDEDVLAGSAAGEREPRGVAGVLTGVSLTRHPDRPLRLPCTQARPILSEDRRRERIIQLATVRSLDGGTYTAVQGEDLLATELLVSDMAAFKAANPGAVLQDMIVWQEQAGQRLQPCVPGNSASASPTASGEPSIPAASAPPVTTSSPDVDQAPHPGGAGSVPTHWVLLWDTTAPCPASAQKQLQDPMVEGERVLHDLDTLDTLDVIDSLLALGLRVAVALLEASKGAQLEPVKQLCERYHRLSQGIISSSIALAPIPGMPRQGQSPGTVAAMGMGIGHRRLVGFQDHILEYLLDELHYLESVVVLAESLCRRLPECEDVSSSLILAATQGKATQIMHTCAPGLGAASGRRQQQAQPQPHRRWHVQQSVLRERVCSTAVQDWDSRAALSRLLAQGLRPGSVQLSPAGSLLPGAWSEPGTESGSSLAGGPRRLNSSSYAQPGVGPGQGEGVRMGLSAGGAIMRPVNTSGQALGAGSGLAHGEGGGQREALALWPPAAHYEWVLTTAMGTGSTGQNATERPQGAGTGAAAGPWDEAVPSEADGGSRVAGGLVQESCLPGSRMFLQHSDGQTRLAFTLLSE